jgi:death-on-curing protein
LPVSADQITFLKLNGLEVTAEKADRYLTFYDLAAGTVTEDELAEWFDRNTDPLQH